MVKILNNNRLFENDFQEFENSISLSDQAKISKIKAVLNRKLILSLLEKIAKNMTFC